MQVVNSRDLLLRDDPNGILGSHEQDQAADQGFPQAGKTAVIYVASTDVIQCDTFIPQSWVFDPQFVVDRLINGGNSRRSGGSSVFNRSSLSYKVLQKIPTTSFAAGDPDGTQATGNSSKDVGPTRVYDFDQAVVGAEVDTEGHAVEDSGHITDAALAETTPNTNGYVGTARASTEGVTLNVSHPEERTVMIRVVANVSNPAVGGSEWGPIKYDFMITVNRTDLLHPTYSISGSHSLFPSYEVYINKQRIHQYDALLEDTGAADLLRGAVVRVNSTDQPLRP